MLHPEIFDFWVDTSYTVMAPLVGGLIDRHGPRRVIVPGILVLTLGLILCASIETLAQFYSFTRS